VSHRVLVVDDHPVFRDGLVALLTRLDGIEVTGTAGDGEQAVTLAASGVADVVLMDLNLPGISGVQATALIRALPEPPSVLVLTMVDDDYSVIAALRAGAAGYVLKGANGDEIAAAVRTVAAGGAVFGAGVATQVLAMTASRSSLGGLEGLTGRERDVLTMIAEGAGNAQIARELGLSLKTVQNYVSRILDKLQVSDRNQAAQHARARDRH
jgi:DNA-binding NarL/FixJ family response regulator